MSICNLHGQFYGVCTAQFVDKNEKPYICGTTDSDGERCIEIGREKERAKRKAPSPSVARLRARIAELEAGLRETLETMDFVFESPDRFRDGYAKVIQAGSRARALLATEVKPEALK